MRTMTLAEMVTGVRFYSDTGFATARVSDAQIQEELWYGMQAYYSLLDKHLIWLDTEIYTFTGTSATRYEIPHPHRLFSVDCQGANGWTMLRRSAGAYGDRTSGQRYTIEYSVGVPFSSVTYTRSTTYLTLHPLTEGRQTGRSFRVRYIRSLTQAQCLPSTGIAFPNAWEEIPILWAAMRVLARNKEDFSGIKFLFEAAVARINSEASSLEIYQAPQAGKRSDEDFYNE